MPPSCMRSTPMLRPADVMGAEAAINEPTVTYAQELSLWYQQFQFWGRWMFRL